MKILIAYDGSDCAEAALDDLRLAGLPREAEATVISLADVFLPPSSDEGQDEAVPFYVPEGVRVAREHAMQCVAQARALAERAAKRVRATFPAWHVRAEAEADSPAWGIIKKADEWRADLVVVGSQGQTALGRLVLGSVSQKVLYEARCSVRIARGRVEVDEAPVRIIVGTDGSPDAEAAINAVAARSWPAGSEARLIIALDTVLSLAPDAAHPSVVKWFETDSEEDLLEARAIFETTAERLRVSGLAATVLMKPGSPQRVLVEEAAEWKADSIFIGARGVRGVERLLLGSVSATVAARAPCSVEVARPPRAG